MRVCTKCFKDNAIIDRIRELKNSGSCDLHGNQDFIYDTEKNSELAGDFNALYEVYSVDINNEYPQSDNIGKLNVLLERDWDIFTIDRSNISQFMIAILDLTNEEVKNIRTGQYIIPDLEDSEIKARKSILGMHTWNDFCESIKYKNRFFTSYLNADMLLEFLEWLKISLDEGIEFYRARISPTGEKFNVSGLKMAPPEIVSSGRLNSEGIGVLYLASSEVLSIKEVRASFQDDVVIAKGILNRTMEIVDLTRLTEISPFAQAADSEFFLNYQINKEILNDIAQDLIKPTGNRNSHFDYLPTQYISDIIKTKYDGIKFKSTMRQGNDFNVALFDDNCIDIEERNIKMVKINEVNYESLEVKDT